MYLLLAFLACLAFGAGIYLGGVMAASSIGFSDEARERRKVQEEVDAMPHCSAETRSRFPTDQRLRNAGFAIHERPADGEPVWTRGGVEFKESFALSLLGS